MAEVPLQVLDADGKTVKKPKRELDPEFLRKVYRFMVLTRIVDERAIMLQRQGRIGFWVPSTGQEAAQIGSVAAAEPQDWIYPSYREPGVALYRGESLYRLFCQLYGNSDDFLKGRQMPNHWSFRSVRCVSISSPVGTQISQAVGTGIAAKIRKDPLVVIVYFGDGATSEGDFHVGMNFAGVFRAPVVFFCSNNQWAISCPVGQQTGSESIAVKAKAYGFSGVRVDGNDVLAVHEATNQAIEKARTGGGPTLIEAVTYRLGPHSSSDDPKRYRPEGELEEWKKRDPIDRFRKHLASRKLWSEDEEKQLVEELRQQVQQAIEKAEKAPPPALETIFEEVFAQPTSCLEEQKQEVLSEQRVHKDTSEAFPL